MDPYSFVVAVLALIVSVFTFYWTSLRKSRALTLFYVNRIGSTNPEFVLANGCNFDLFLVHVSLALRGTDKTATLWPNQNSDLATAGGSLVAAGQVVRCHIQFIGALRQQDLEMAAEDPRFKMPKVRTFDGFVQVHWIEPSGREYQSESKIGSYMFNEQGNVAATQEMERKFSLYQNKTEVLPGSRPIVP